MFFGLEGAVWGLVFSQAINCLLSYWAIRAEARTACVPLGCADWRREFGILWTFALPGMLSGVIMAPMTWWASVLVATRPGGYAEMGLYNVANQWRNMIMFLPGILMQVVLPVFSSTNNSHNGRSQFQQILIFSQSAMVAFIFPLCTALMFSSSLVLRLYGHGYDEAGTLMVACIFTTLVQCIGASTGPALQAKGKMWLGFSFNLSYGVLLLGFVLIFVRFGAAALAFGSAFSYVVLTVWAFLYLRHDLPAGMLRRVGIALVVAAIIALVCLLLPTSWKLLLAIPAFILAALCAIFWLTDQQFRKTLLRQPVP
jgi:O-antigen/teichoic acid export membrane protein